MSYFKEVDRENQEIDLFGALDFVFGKPIHEEEGIVVYLSTQCPECERPIEDTEVPKCPSCDPERGE